MNWMPEGHLSWNWLQWMREVTGENLEPLATLPQLLRGMEQWDEAIARDRHSTGDPDRISSGEYFMYAASMMSRAAKTAIDDALKYAMTWDIDEPMNWSSLPPEAKDHWAAALHIITTVLDAWIMLWNDLARLQDQLSAASPEELLAQWKDLADQAVQTVEGIAVAASAQGRR